MSDLIERLEKASEAEQHDLILEAAFHCWSQAWINDGGYYRTRELLAASAYIEAVLLLVPTETRKENGIWWRLSAFGGAHGTGKEMYQADVQRITTEPADLQTYRGFGFTPALALCIAALRARGVTP